MNLFDTIAAVSTPYGKGGVALIRISGADAVSIAQKAFRTKNGKPLSACEHAKMTYGEIFFPDEYEHSIDDGMAVVFYAPRSFTGEDTVEITCHGGVLITQKVLSAVLCAGARIAQAGEFTRRAFVSGKMKLSEAESLGNLLEARSEGQLQLARSGMRGVLSEKADELYTSLLTVLSAIYATLDFPDEDLAEISREEMEVRISDTLSGIDRLASTYRTGRAVTEGIPTVICGRTNAGKSSVYNRILGYDAAIVTDIEGTTRDVLRETAILGKVTLRLCDTAGLRQTADTVESIGIERSMREIENSELILLVLDGSKPLEDEDRKLLERIKISGKSAIALINKSDISTLPYFSDLNAYMPSLLVSASTGDGFDALTDTVEQMFIDGDIDISSDAVVTGARQYAALKNASEILGRAVADMHSGVSLDACCVGVECAMSALGELDGREVGEEIVAEIFSKFCVGK